MNVPLGVASQQGPQNIGILLKYYITSQPKRQG